MTTSRRPRAALRIVGWLAVLGAAAGAVWAFLAPPVRMLVVAEDRGVVLTTESLHSFDAIAIFAGIGLVLGVLSAVAVWGMRRSRGPAALAALVVGSGVGAGVAALVGMGVARLRFPDVESPAVGDIVAAAPGLVTPTVLILQPLAAALIYLLLVSLSPDDDLGISDHKPAAEPAPDVAVER
ncbi:DUF2567 domain-containing protein [Prescottella defluvii]|uniref:DUF2567 domain-containing protein n=1 Tax=Prescottella defluvii TaxID=1323361 RepID=UPI000A801461|nr:DUF2567 domain-containing protein [Prescottella defluvii]